MQFDTHLIPNPGNTREWSVLLKKGVGTSYFLIDEQDEVETFTQEVLAGKYDETVAQIDAIIQDFQRRLYR